LTLEQALLQEGEAILGKPYTKEDKFPLLIKFIDAQDKLSVQVHPEDAYAFEHENGEFGKSEAWYIVQADPGAKLVAGLKDGVTKEKFIEYLNQNRIEELLNEVEVKAGDVLDIPAGLIHAIGDGILLAEIQQNSDTTYRVYDWGRAGLDGLPREMHIRQSLDVIDFEQKHSKELVMSKKNMFDGYQLAEFVRNTYFVLQELKVTKSYKQEGQQGFEIYVCVQGHGQISYTEGTKVETMDIHLGDSFLIPKTLKEYTLHAKESTITLMKGFVEV
jgi:mannose-6-phosphate isomerase